MFGSSLGQMLNYVNLFGKCNLQGPGVRSYPSRMIGVSGSINRHTGQPHEHKREIARRLRQADRHA